jgi:RNA polymerase sigma-70 factor (ECF subfamily)
MTVFRGRADLLRQFRDGDRDALETVYRAYVHRIGAIVRRGLRMPVTAGAGRGRASRPEDLGDLVQEIFLRAFAPPARTAFDGEREYAPYLFALARNVMVDWARREGREVPTAWPEMEVLANAASEAETEPDADPQLRSIVDGYLATLDPELRRVHEVRYLRCLSQEESAAVLGISRQSLRTLEKRLRTGLRRAIKLHELSVGRSRQMI